MGQFQTWRSRCTTTARRRRPVAGSAAHSTPGDVQLQSCLDKYHYYQDNAVRWHVRRLAS